MELLAAVFLSVALWLPGVGSIQQSDLPPLPPPFCGELTEADCQLLTDSQDVMRGVSSMEMSLGVNASVAGIPDVADEDMVFDMNTDMTLHFDPALNEQLRAMALRSPEELLATQEEFGQLIVDLYATMAMRLEMDMSMPKLLRDAIEQDEGVILPATIPVAIRMVNGYLYIDMDTLADSFPELRDAMASDGIQGWVGMDLAGQLRQDLLSSGVASDASAMQSLQLGVVFNQLMADEAMRNLLEPHVTVERLDDEVRDGAPVAIFRTTIELGDMVSNPNFTRLLRQAAESMIAASGERVDSQELGAGILAVQLLANVLARAYEFEVVQSVGVDTPYVYDYSIYLQLDLSGLLALAAMGGEELPPELSGAQPVFTFDMNASYGAFNDAPAVEAPENAQILPLDSMDQDSLDVIS